MKQILDVLAKNKFLPSTDDPKILPDGPGVYIICAQDVECLPNAMKILEYMFFKGYPVIYTGIAGRPTSKKKSLRNRDYKNHFKGNARGSTLRKSLGVLLELTKEQRPKEIETNKFMFTKQDELYLSSWMKKNLMLFYYENENPIDIEKTLINYFHPPLNLKDNFSKENSAFREMLSDLRKFNTIKRFGRG